MWPSLRRFFAAAVVPVVVCWFWAHEFLRGSEPKPADDAWTVPRVNVGRLLDAQSRRKTVAHLAHAARHIGVVRLTNHSVDINSAHKAGKAYFALPAHLKDCPACSVRNASSGFQRGYIPIAGESGLAGVVEVKEGFSYGYEWPTQQQPEHPFQAPNVWPPQETLDILPSRWKETMSAFFGSTVDIASTVVTALAEVLGTHGAELTALCEGGDAISPMRVFHYLPPPENSTGRFMGSSPHTDWHTVTIIARDAASMLQFQDPRTGAWSNITVEDDDLILLIGDWLSAFSGGQFHSAPHRVLLPERDSSITFVLFFYPSHAARLPERRVKGQAPQGELNTIEESMFRLPWGDYVMQKWAKVMSNR